MTDAATMAAGNAGICGCSRYETQAAMPVELQGISLPLFIGFTGITFTGMAFSAGKQDAKMS